MTTTTPTLDDLLTGRAPLPPGYALPDLTPAPVTRPFRVHTATGDTFTHTRLDLARWHAGDLARLTGDVVAVERWDDVRGLWVLLDTAGTPR